MKTLILCDSDCLYGNDTSLATRVESAVRDAGSETIVVVLKGDEIKPCRGCLRCWIKTPGLCILTGDCAGTVACREIQADVMIIISRIIYGGYSYDVKAFLDRSIPNMSPYYEIVNGEMHHEMRYDRFPDWIAIGYGDFSPRERQTFIDLAERNALNMRSQKFFAFAAQDENETEETLKALSNILLQEVSR